MHLYIYIRHIFIIEIIKTKKNSKNYFFVVFIISKDENDIKIDNIENNLIIDNTKIYIDILNYLEKFISLAKVPKPKKEFIGCETISVYSIRYAGVVICRYVEEISDAEPSEAEKELFLLFELSSVIISFFFFNSFLNTSYYDYALDLKLAIIIFLYPF